MQFRHDAQIPEGLLAENALLAEVSRQGSGWSYDSFGNRYGQTSNSSNFPTTWANYAATNQMTASSSAPGGISYDAAGNVTNDGNNQYLYDAEGKVCAVTSSLFSLTTQYVYDAEGQRVAKMSGGTPGCAVLPTFSPSTTYLRGAHGELVTELAGNNWNYPNVYANGSLLATYRGNETYFALNDWLGTKRVEVTPDGQTSSFASLPFGDFLTQQGNATDATEDHFTGKERDAESGLDYFGARYMASSMGRFMSPDWSVKAEPVPYSKLDNPQSLNLYSYVLNNPLSHIDVDGHSCSTGGQDSGFSGCGGGASGGAGAGGDYGEPGPSRVTIKGYGGTARVRVNVAEVDTISASLTALVGGGGSSAVEPSASASSNVAPAPSVDTPYGPAIQGSSAAETEALAAARNGATVYRSGMTGVQHTAEGQFWSFSNPATTPGYANQMGMPSLAAGEGSVPFIMSGQLAPEASAITRFAPAVAGGGEGGALELVVPFAARAITALGFIVP